jgi:hypothetical protein
MARRFKTILDPSDREERKRWIRALKSVGVDGVKRDCSRAQAARRARFTGVQYMTRGFAEAWVEHQKQREGRSAKYWQWATILVAIGGISGYTIRPLIERAWTALFGAD